MSGVRIPSVTLYLIMSKEIFLGQSLEADPYESARQIMETTSWFRNLDEDTREYMILQEMNRSL